MRPRSTFLVLFLATAALGACATATPYQPLQSGSAASGGYTNQRITENRYRVNFVGNSLTSRPTVENYLLYRAAELTTQQGFDWFAMADRQTDTNRNTYVDRPYGPGAYGYWGPSWRYRGRGFGWRSWDPYRGDPFWGDTIDVHTVTSFEATAEIIMHRGPAPGDDRTAFDARSVLQNLGPEIQRPD
jgi:hypothetical protein